VQKKLILSQPVDVACDTGQSVKGERNPDYFRKGMPTSRLYGIFAEKQAAASSDPRRSGRNRISRLPARDCRRA
jgi:hypothetical protein